MLLPPPSRPPASLAAMLKVEKELLEAETTQKVAHLRQVELQYYIDHIGSIQSMATLLAGFAFTAFIGFDGGFNFDALLFRTASSVYEGGMDANGTLRVEQVVQNYDVMMVIKFCFEVCEVAAVTLTLGEMLYVMIESLIARLLGSRLALRGPEGSITTANKHLAEALANSTKHFIMGLQWFLLSILSHALRGMHVGLSMLVLFILAIYWKSQFAAVGRLASQFELKAAVMTDFEGHDLEAAADAECSPSPRGRSPRGRSPKPIWRKGQPKGGRNQRRSLIADLPNIDVRDVEVCLSLYSHRPAPSPCAIRLRSSPIACAHRAGHADGRSLDVPPRRTVSPTFSTRCVRWTLSSRR